MFDKFSQALTLMREAFEDAAAGAQRVINAASAVQALRVAQFAGREEAKLPYLARAGELGADLMLTLLREVDEINPPRTRTHGGPGSGGVWWHAHREAGRRPLGGPQAQ